MLKYLLCLAMAAAASRDPVRAQETNLENDTVRVSMSNGSVLLFPGEIEFVSPSCSEYSHAIGSNDLTVRVRSSKPREPFCTMLVREGSKGHKRQHQLVLQYVDVLRSSEQIHDYSTEAKLEQRIAANRARPEISKETVPAKTAEKPVFTASLTTGSTPASSALGIDTALINTRVRYRVALFYMACNQLARKEDIANAISYGMKLFNDREEALVEVVSRGERRSKRIRQYFTSLSQLPYQRVEMTTSELMYVTDFRQAPDGRWFGAVQFIQDFRGFRDGNVASYIDRTNKTMELELRTREHEENGRTVRTFDIFLSNISVTNIR